MEKIEMCQVKAGASGQLSLGLSCQSSIAAITGTRVLYNKLITDPHCTRLRVPRTEEPNPP